MRIFYIAQTMWLWSDWRKQRDKTRRIEAAITRLPELLTH